MRVNRLLPAFIDYCERQFPSEFVKEMKKQQLFAAGYINDSPTICYFKETQPGGPFGCIQDSGFIESAPTLFSNYGKRLLLMSSKEVADLAEKAIREHAKQDGRWKTIGGPINILLITKTSLLWIKNKPPLRRWTYIQDLVKEYREGKVEFNLIPPATRKQLDDLLATVPGV